jgi:predicted nucleotidyltransferase
MTRYAIMRTGEVMTQRDYEIAKTLKERLSEVVGLIDFRVFGSRARGDEDEYSDMDVFVEVESIDRELKEKISDIVWQVGFDHFIVISPLIFTRNEIENSPLRASPIVRNIMEEGVAV